MKKIVMGKKVVCDYRKTCYGIVFKLNKLLITHNKNIDEYSLIGGGVEYGESLEQALKREFLEESGFVIDNFKEYVNIDCFWTKYSGRKMETDANFMLVKVKEDEVYKPIEDFHETMWIDMDKAIDLINFPYQKYALQLFFKELKEIDYF